VGCDTLNTSRLSKNEIDSALWKKVKGILQDRLQSAKTKLEKDITENETVKLRGRIAELNYLIDLENPSPSNLINAEKSPLHEEW